MQEGAPAQLRDVYERRARGDFATPRPRLADLGEYEVAAGIPDPAVWRGPEGLVEYTRDREGIPRGRANNSRTWVSPTHRSQP